MIYFTADWHNIKEWCKIYGISTNSVYQRIKKGNDCDRSYYNP